VIAGVVALLVLAIGVAARPVVLDAGRVDAPERLPIRPWLDVGAAIGQRRSPRPGRSQEVVRLRTALAGGASIAGAFDALARSGGPWAESAGSVVRSLRAGRPVAAVLRAWSDGDDDRRLVADALAIATDIGGSQVGALDAVVATLAERQALGREIRALASQATASALVLVLTPLGFAVAVAVLDERVRRFYVGSALGPACVLGGLLLDAVGGWWMLRLVRSVR
jgi:tight adherence protein B